MRPGGYSNRRRAGTTRLVRERPGCRCWNTPRPRPSWPTPRSPPPPSAPAWVGCVCSSPATSGASPAPSSASWPRWSFPASSPAYSGRPPSRSLTWPTGPASRSSTSSGPGRGTTTPSAELRRHVAEVVADPEGVLVLDGSGFAKKGEASCGVQRQSCGRLGQVENCQVGLFLAYVAAGGGAGGPAAVPAGGLGQRPGPPGADPRARGGGVPGGVADRPGPDRPGEADLPFGWVAGDDEYGRATEFRAGLRRRELRYALDVPCSTLVRDIDEGPPPGSRCPPWRRVDEWARRLPASVAAGRGGAGVEGASGGPGGGGWVQTRGRAAGWGRWSGWW
ncbi:MAG: transposase [Gemmataceae bacterium]